MWWTVLPTIQDIKDSLEMTKSEKMIGKTYGTICVDLSDCMDYLQIQTQAVESRIDFVKGLCDYLTMMDYHHLVSDLNKIYLTYQSGLNGCNTPGYADSILHEFSRTLAQSSVTSFFQESPASPESDSERDKRYKKAYDMLKSFNANLGLWIQFDRGRDPLSAQKTVVEHFKVFLRAYLNLNSLGDRTIDNDIDYDDVNQVLKEKDWDAFVVCRDRFFVNELADTATSSGSFQPSSLGS